MAVKAVGQNARQFRKEITKVVSLKYQLYFPASYTENRKTKLPLMLFLHGAGERGNDVAKVKKHGPPKLVQRRKTFPFVVVSPQCRENEWWEADGLLALVDDVCERYRIDEDRIYVTGLSMGGYGTWMLGGADPDRFAAIAPICGGGRRMDARQIAQAKLPTWVFHGAKDTTVLIDESERMVEMIERFDGDVKFTTYPKAQHDSWTETYNNPELYAWFWSHKRSDRV